MTDFCVCDIAKGEVVEVVASDSVTPRVQQLLQRHGRYYVFDGFDEAQGLVFLTSDYGHFVYLPISQVVLK